MESARYTAFLQGSLRLSSEGTWIHNGLPFQNEKLAQLFHRSIVWDDSRGCYKLVIGREEALFTVDDTAFFVIWLDDSSYPWKLGLSTGETLPLDERTLRGKDEYQRVYCTVKDFHEAKFLRAAHQVLVSHISEDSMLEIGGKKIALV